ncbi:MAG TPA: DUF1501 domain-containing protein [Caulobacteraceae bacterium]|jgi:uncharacterized protein (DUF1501 family)
MSALALSRRQLLRTAAGGASLSFLGHVAYAASEGAAARGKLIVVVLRGGMDGMSAVPPVGDPQYRALRGDVAIAPFGAPQGALKLDQALGLHPKLNNLHTFVGAGEARIAPAVATPDRARSHFQAQDVLENGGAGAHRVSTGWMNRTLQVIGRDRKTTAIAVGDQTPLLLYGKAQTSSWNPGGQNTRDAKLTDILMDLYAGDPVLGPALTAGLETAEVAADAAESGGDMASGAAKGRLRPQDAEALGRATGRLVAAPNGPSLVAMSLYGFDTHAIQGAGEGSLALRLETLDNTLAGLKLGLGPAWADTTVIFVTEFGRTARVNGTRGTDHGTASAAFVAGGGLRRGGTIGDWPGLARLYEDRDLTPTLDTRALFKAALAGQFGLNRQALDTVVFPESAGVAPYAGLIA